MNRSRNRSSIAAPGAPQAPRDRQLEQQQRRQQRDDDGEQRRAPPASNRARNSTASMTVPTAASATPAASRRHGTRASRSKPHSAAPARTRRLVDRRPQLDGQLRALRLVEGRRAAHAQQHRAAHRDLLAAVVGGRRRRRRRVSRCARLVRRPVPVRRRRERVHQPAGLPAARDRARDGELLDGAHRAIQRGDRTPSGIRERARDQPRAAAVVDAERPHPPRQRRREPVAARPFAKRRRRERPANACRRRAGSSRAVPSGAPAPDPSPAPSRRAPARRRRNA